MQEPLPPSTLWVSKLTRRTNAPAVIEVAHLSGAHAHEGNNLLQWASLSGLEARGFAGRHRLEHRLSRGDKSKPVDLEIVERGKVFDLFLRADGQITARGMGITDPQSSDSLLVSWWSGSLTPTGIVKYMVSKTETNTVDAVYTSTAMEAAGIHDTLGGRATGDTAGGFPGRYKIIYEGVHGTSHGPFDWEIFPRGQAFDLTWKTAGKMLLRGFGFEDPDFPQSLVVIYWSARD